MENSVYIVLSRTHTLMARAVRVFTGSYYSHASLSLEKDLKETYSFGRKRPRLILPAGFISELEKGMYLTSHKDANICILEMRVEPEEFEKIKGRLELFLQQPHKYGYNTIGLPFLMLGIPFQRKHHYTCSAFVADVLQDVVEFDKDLSLAQPEDFLNFGFEIVYKGSLGEFLEK